MDVRIFTAKYKVIVRAWLSDLSDGDDDGHKACV